MLEAAVERLAQAIERRLAQPAADGDGVPRAEVAALAQRLDDTIARLRAALPSGDEMGSDDLPDEEE